MSIETVITSFNAARRALESVTVNERRSVLSMLHAVFDDGPKPVAAPKVAPKTKPKAKKRAAYGSMGAAIANALRNGPMRYRDIGVAVKGSPSDRSVGAFLTHMERRGVVHKTGERGWWALGPTPAKPPVNQHHLDAE